jgi:hypothetical protein
MSVRRLSTSSVLNAFPKTNNAWDQTTNAATFDCLGTVTLGSAAASIVFAGIPQTYTHLQLRLSLRGSNSSAAYATIKFNNDTTAANYYRHVTYTTGGVVEGANSSTTTYLGVMHTADLVASAFTPFMADIPNYASSSRYKTIRNFTGFDTNGGGEVSLTSMIYLSNNPITTITLTPSAGNFVQYSHASLYGVK